MRLLIRPVITDINDLLEVPMVVPEIPVLLGPLVSAGWVFTGRIALAEHSSLVLVDFGCLVMVGRLTPIPMAGEISHMANSVLIREDFFGKARVRQVTITHGTEVDLLVNLHALGDQIHAHHGAEARTERMASCLNLIVWVLGFQIFDPADNIVSDCVHWVVETSSYKAADALETKVFVGHPENIVV